MSQTHQLDNEKPARPDGPRSRILPGRSYEPAPGVLSTLQTQISKNTGFGHRKPRKIVRAPYVPMRDRLGRTTCVSKSRKQSPRDFRIPHLGTRALATGSRITGERARTRAAGSRSTQGDLPRIPVPDDSISALYNAGQAWVPRGNHRTAWAVSYTHLTLPTNREV